MGRLGGSTTPWECEWEHKDGRVCEREDSVRVDLVVVRHHGSVSGNTRMGECVREKTV